MHQLFRADGVPPSRLSKTSDRLHNVLAQHVRPIKPLAKLIKARSGVQGHSVGFALWSSERRSQRGVASIDGGLEPVQDPLQLALA